MSCRRPSSGSKRSVHEELEHRHRLETGYFDRQAERTLDAPRSFMSLLRGKFASAFRSAIQVWIAGLRNPSGQAFSNGEFGALGHLSELVELIGIPQVPD